MPKIKNHYVYIIGSAVVQRLTTSSNSDLSCRASGNKQSKDLVYCLLSSVSYLIRLLILQSPVKLFLNTSRIPFYKLSITIEMFWLNM